MRAGTPLIFNVAEEFRQNLEQFAREACKFFCIIIFYDERLEKNNISRNDKAHLRMRTGIASVS